MKKSKKYVEASKLVEKNSAENFFISNGMRRESTTNLEIFRQYKRQTKNNDLQDSFNLLVILPVGIINLLYFFLFLYLSE